MNYSTISHPYKMIPHFAEEPSTIHLMALNNFIHYHKLFIVSLKFNYYFMKLNHFEGGGFLIGYFGSNCRALQKDRLHNIFHQRTEWFVDSLSGNSRKHSRRYSSFHLQGVIII